MKLVHEETLISAGSFAHSQDYNRIHRQIIDSIKAIVWPPNSSNFTIPPGKHLNGVVPIKLPLVEYLLLQGWTQEFPMNMAGNVLRPGDLDVVTPAQNSYYAVEWETGNISSSHRALNKLVLGMMNGLLLGGTLILPSRLLYPHLTDRIGNYEELAPYFHLWRSVPVNNGVLSVISVEYDELDSSVPHIPKGTDGRALR